jgi:hypothetical protein
MAFRDASGFDTTADRAPDDELDAQWIAAWKAAAQAAIAARQPQPAPGEVAAIVDTAVKEWLDRRTATALATAPGIDDREQGKRQGIDDLRQRLDDYWYVLTPAILAALGNKAQPAPGLAAARPGEALAADNARLREQLAKVLGWFQAHPGWAKQEATATRAQLASAYRDGGLTVPDELRRFL